MPALFVLIPAVVILGGLAALVQRLREIGKDEKLMKPVSIKPIPAQAFETLEAVKGTVVYGKDPGRDFMAGMKARAGGEITGNTGMLNGARQMAAKRRAGAAKELGAGAVAGLRHASSVMPRAAEAIACGTAVRFC